MKDPLPHKIVLGITGSIAAYKSFELLRQLQQNDYEVRMVLTKSAELFISKLSLAGLFANQVYLDQDQERNAMLHIELAKWADLILIAPASANFLARIANGFADELLTTICLATAAPIYLAPSMNKEMWNNHFTRLNVDKLKIHSQYTVIGPNFGLQACGDIGLGRMSEPEEIIAKLKQDYDNMPLSGINVIITAGGTREYIDPVRYISNKSSGKMGYAMAEAAAFMGATVTLISANVNLNKPTSIAKFIAVETADEMLDQVKKAVCSKAIFISCAAVSDFKVKNYAKHKIKKANLRSLDLQLTQSPDILKTIASDQSIFCIGFCAETENLIKNAQEKLLSKGVSLIVANDVSRDDIGFNSDFNQVTLIAKDELISLDRAPKLTIAKEIMLHIYKKYMIKHNLKSCN